MTGEERRAAFDALGRLCDAVTILTGVIDAALLTTGPNLPPDDTVRLEAIRCRCRSASVQVGAAVAALASARVAVLP